MEYKEGTVFELGDIKNRFIVISIVNIDTLKDEDNGTYVIDQNGQTILAGEQEQTINHYIVTNYNYLIREGGTR